RNCQTNLLRRLQINDQLKLLWLLYREISRLGAFENLVHVGGSASEEVGIVWGIGQKPPVLYILWLPIHCRQSVLYSEICNLYSVRIEGRRPPARGLHRRATWLRLGKRAQYPWVLERLGSEAAP